MRLDFDSTLPLYKQIAKQIEEGVMKGVYSPGTQIPSTTEISKRYNVNPATVLKGMNLLVSKKILVKRRGIGMFVTENGSQLIFEERKEQFINENIVGLVAEAKGLNLSKSELLVLIERGFENE
ncbi:GntR family transcriptional regulator [Vagococcus sp. PNs007]|uniref:GntR family transcriptional regulator n=1 Tax=Vagococcus proximus TaxID=2991417 RepID=A0ABT5WZ77_9ENTE|nr:GntR family transcriptional regulator [Vagococcus proximus]MDF0479063.1 GntR family transcriptional regulator [Vagococcus proximus]